VAKKLILSSVAQKLSDRVDTTLNDGVTTHYNSDFLYRYLPNYTEYLDVASKMRLHQIGDIKARSYDEMQQLLLSLIWESTKLQKKQGKQLKTKNLLQCVYKDYRGVTKEERVVLNCQDAISFLFEHIAEEGINHEMICSLHRLLSNGLLHSNELCGELRREPVVLGYDIYYIPLNIPHLIQKEFHKIIEVANAINDPFEQSFFLLVYLSYLQPFCDINKRTAGLSANIPLILNGLCPFTFVDLHQEDYAQAFLAIYRFNRTELLRDFFIWSYERSVSYYEKFLKAHGLPY